MGRFFRHLVIVLLSIVSYAALAQITVSNSNPYNSVTYLVNNVLLGSGVTASNIQFNPGNSGKQIGFFAGNAGIGLSSGIVISTGEVIDVAQGNNTGSNIDTDLFGAGDSDLNIIAAANGNTTQDAGVLSFDFIPKGDTVTFKFVFASDEYHLYVGTPYNDVFGFFISGPGITGPYSGNAKNIALIPGTSTPVQISTINNGSSNSGPCMNCQYFDDNTNGTKHAFNANTTVLTATTPVQCGKTHHIKIAIGDAGDGSLDSGVFLEAGSFSSNEIQVTAQTSFPTLGGDSVLFEGCGTIDLTFNRTGDINFIDTIQIVTDGNAQEFIDYTSIPDYIVFANGDDQTQFSFNANLDGNDEGLELLELMLITNFCSTGDTVRKNIYISDPPPVETETVDETRECFEATQSISVTPTYGLPDFTFLWNTGETTQSIDVSPDDTTMYFVTVTDFCNLRYNIDTVTVNVPIRVPRSFTSDTSVQCAAEPVLISVLMEDGTEPYQFEWSNTPKDSIAQVVKPLQTQTYFVTITDACKRDTMYREITVVVPVYPPLFAYISTDTVRTICPMRQFAVTPAASGGSGGYLFSWDNWKTLTDSLVVKPDSIKTDTLRVTDFCRTDTVIKTFTVIPNIYEPLAMTLELDTFLCPGDSTAILVNVTGGAGDYRYTWSDFKGSSDSIMVKPDKTTSYTINVKDFCNNEVEETFDVNIQVPIADFKHEFNTDLTATFRSESSWDASIFKWNFGDKTSSDEEHPEHLYEEENNYEVTLYVENRHGCSDSITHEITMPTQLWVPNAFTPDHDGLNDEFSFYGVGFTEFQIMIFNRWGQLIYQSQNLTDTWDGGKSPDGAYVWKVYGKGYNDEYVEIYGQVMLIR